MGRWLFATALLVSATASADPIEVSGDSCDPDAVRDHLTAIQRDPNAPSISVSWRTEGGEILATVRLADGREREIIVGDCAELTDSIALMVGMVLAQPSPPPPAPPAPAPRVDVTVRQPPRTVKVVDALQLAVVASGSITERATPLFSAGLRLHTPSVDFAFELEASTAEQVGLAQGYARIRYRGVGVATCVPLGSWDPCAVFRAGLVSGAGTGYGVPLEASSFDAAAGLNLGWRLHLSSSFTLRPFVEGTALMTRNRFHVDDMEVWSNGAWEGRVGLAVDTSIL